MNLSFLFHNQFFLSISAQDPDPLDPKDFGLLDPDPETYADPHGAKLKKNEKKRDYKNFLVSRWFIKFQHKNKRKKEEK